tara:strand:- start:1216 stop:1833 length:618 start_codon:yes stop_codon:yes gene_type:complete
MNKCHKTAEGQEGSNESYVDYLLSFYWNEKIQLDKNIAREIAKKAFGKKMLVFGLGYDSLFWYHATKGQTYFIEDDEDFIFFNKDLLKNIIPYNYYGTSVSKSLDFLKNPSGSYYSLTPPIELIKLAPYDVIFVDGPKGFRSDLPGRLHPIKWSSNLINNSGSIYIDDAGRELEEKAINEYLPEARFLKTNRGNTVAIYDNEQIP